MNPIVWREDAFQHLWDRLTLWLFLFAMIYWLINWMKNSTNLLIDSDCSPVAASGMVSSFVIPAGGWTSRTFRSMKPAGSTTPQKAPQSPSCLEIIQWSVRNWGFSNTYKRGLCMHQKVPCPCVLGKVINLTWFVLWKGYLFVFGLDNCSASGWSLHFLFETQSSQFHWWKDFVWLLIMFSSFLGLICLMSRKLACSWGSLESIVFGEGLDHWYGMRW